MFLSGLVSLEGIRSRDFHMLKCHQTAVTEGERLLLPREKGSYSFWQRAVARNSNYNTQLLLHGSQNTGTISRYLRLLNIIMKGTDASLRLCFPINEMSVVSLGRGPASPSNEPQDHHPELNCFYTEAGQVETDKFRFADWSELVWLKEWLQLCSDYRTFVNMGNRQGMRIETKVDSLAKSNGIQRSNRRPGGFVYSDRTLLNLKGTPTSLQQTTKFRKLSTSSPTNEDSLEEERHFTCASAILRQEQDEKDDGQMDLKQSWRANLSAKEISRLNRKYPFSSREDEIFPSVSETDLSEYDDICPIFDWEPTEDMNRNALQSKVSSQNEDVLLGQSSWATTAARVTRKIEEVEGIIRRVSLTSSSLIKRNGNARDESLRRLQIQTRDKEYEGDSARLLDELRCLCEELSESLQRALRMEGENKEWLSLCVQREHKIAYKNNRLESMSGSIISTVPNNSLSSCLSTSSGIPNRSSTSPSNATALTWGHNQLDEDICDQHALWTSSAKDSWSEKESLDWANHRWREETQTHRCLSESGFGEDDLLSSDEALQKPEDFWQQELEESLSFCRWFSHPSRPKLVDFLRITAPEDDISRTPTPVFPGLRSETTSPIEEERTPGRLQAVWPPPRDEKVGLKYTEAEHQAALLQLKRECKEEVEKLQEDFSKELSQLRLENEVTVSRLERTLAELQAKLSLRRGELRDAAVSTQEDTFPRKAFRAVCIQTDRENFVKSDGDAKGSECSQNQQRVTPKTLDLASIGSSLAGRREGGPPCPSYGHHVQTLKSPLPPPPPPPPPPPAPFMSAAVPPPPPPPPSMISHVTPPMPPSLSATPRKPVVEPSCPMKPLYWTRIQIEDNKNNTLWNVLEEPQLTNAVEFEDLFAKTTTQLKRKPLVDNYEKKTKARKIIKLLDGKRSQAVGILISSLHLEMKDIRQAVLTVDNSVVDLETIEALYENRAQPEELEKIKTHYNTSKEEEVKHLDKPEQFLYELSQIPDFAGRARCIIFKAAFNDGVASIQHKLDVIASVCEALLEKNGVKEVLGLILALGNHMNGGNRIRGQADGFGLEILPKLKDVKSKDNRISLVDYLVSYYLHNVDKNAGTDKSTFPLPESQDVFLAAQLNFDDLTAELRKLGRDLAGCEKDVQKVCSDSPEEHLQPFKDRMETFLLSARKEQVGASYQLMTAQKSFQDLCVYFGLKPKTGEKEVTSSHFFMLWFEFCADFKARWKRENRNFAKERLKEAQQSVRRITSEKKVETRKIIPNSLKERLRQKEANMNSV
ncbi:formin [Festucalex cinctus]